MNEIAKIPWLKVLSNFIWILGAAIILADFSYHEFLSNLQKAKIAEVIKRDSFKKPFLLGLILVATGISASIHQPWLAVIIGIVDLLLIIWFVKITKNQTAEKKEKND